MLVLTASNPRTQAPPPAANVPVPDKFFEACQAALQRSQNYLLSVQKPEGYWVGELMVDSTLVSDMVAYHHWDRSVDKEWERKAVNHIFSMPVSYTHLRAHETRHDLVCRLLLE